MSRRPAGVTGAPVCAAQEGTATVGRIPFRFEGDFAAVSQEEYKRRARDPRFDYAHRVEYAPETGAQRLATGPRLAPGADVMHDV